MGFAPVPPPPLPVCRSSEEFRGACGPEGDILDILIASTVATGQKFGVPKPASARPPVRVREIVR